MLSLQLRQNFRQLQAFPLPSLEGVLMARGKDTVFGLCSCNRHIRKLNSQEHPHVLNF